jgi:Flp pilus assembly protein TadB
MIIHIVVFALISIGLITLFMRKESAINLRQMHLKERRERITKQRITKTERIKIVIYSVLKQSGHSTKAFVIGCTTAATAGLILGYLLFSGFILAVATAIVMLPLPYLLFYLRAAKVRRSELDNLEQSMSIITNSFASSFDIVAAVEGFNNERNRGIPPHLRIQTPYDAFVTNATLTLNSVDKSLVILDSMVSNHYFSEWVKTLRMCGKDRGMVFALFPIIQAMSDAKIAQIEADTKIESAWREYIMTVVVMFSIIPMFRFINADWYAILVGTPIGQLLLLLMLISTLISAVFVAKIAKQEGGV